MVAGQPGNRHAYAGDTFLEVRNFEEGYTGRDLYLPSNLLPTFSLRAPKAHVLRHAVIEW
jgi:hypothetical protein